MTEKRLLIYEETPQYTQSLQDILSLDTQITSTQSKTTLTKLYHQDPKRFTHIILISPQLNYAFHRFARSLQKTSPFAEIIILTKETTINTTYNFIKSGIPLVPLDTPIRKIYNNILNLPNKVQDRIHRYLSLLIEQKIKEEYQHLENELNPWHQKLQQSKCNTNILVLEPEPCYNHRLREALPKKYLTITAESSQEALVTLQKQQVSIFMITDSLPDIQTELLIQNSRKKSPICRTILLTTNRTTETLETWHQTGIHNCIFKPFTSTEQIVNTIEKELHTRFLTLLFDANNYSQTLNLFNKKEKIAILEEIYELKKSIHLPFCFEDILRFFPEANIHKDYAKQVIPDHKLNTGIENFIKKEI